MHAKHLFEYAVVRVVPRVEREEFINVGVILFCKTQKFLQVKYLLDEKRLHALAAELDAIAVAANLKAFEQICLGTKEGGAIGELDTASRFRWLTATRSTVLQTSKVHPGFCLNAAQTLDRLFEGLVL